MYPGLYCNLWDGWSRAGGREGSWLDLPVGEGHRQGNQKVEVQKSVGAQTVEQARGPAV